MGEENVSPDTGPVTAALDELAIRNLLATVAQLTDYGELDDYLDLYTEDGVWELPTANAQVGIGATRLQGRRELREGVEERRAKGVQGPGTNTIHVITTTALHFQGPDVAIASSFWMYFAQTDQAPVLRSIGHYEDLVRRTVAGWKLAHRRVTPGGPPSRGWRPGGPPPGGSPDRMVGEAG